MIGSATSIIGRLQFISDKASDRGFELTQDRVNIGRDNSNVICLDHSTVSLHHAILIRSGEHYRVRDLISTNGTYINGERATGAELRSGDILHFGEVEMRYEEVEPPAEESREAPKRGVLPLGRQRPSAAPAKERQYKIVGADGRTYGPATGALVRKWISQGFANAQTWVPAESRGNWKQLGEFPEFTDLLDDNLTPSNLLGTPPKDARWAEPVKVAPSMEPELPATVDEMPVVMADRAQTTKKRRRNYSMYVGVLLFMALAASGAAWWFDQWPFDSHGPLRKYARNTEGYIYSDPDFTAASAAEDAKNYPELLKNAKLLVGSYPMSSLARYILGVAYGKLGFYPDAAAAFQQAIKLKPDYIDAWNNLGWADTQAGKFGDAVGVFQQLIKFTPNDARIWSNLGGAQAGQGHEADAIAAYQMAIQLKPDYADAHFNLGAAYANQGQFMEAVKSFRLALKYQPDFAEAWFNLGVISGRQGEDNDAIVFFQRAIKMKPGYAEAWGGLVKAYLKLRQPDKAGEAAREMKRIDPVKADQLADELTHDAPQPLALTDPTKTE
jgi:tetratricopeptide (TPR) repeat protein